MVTTRHEQRARLSGRGSAAGGVSAPKFRGWRWRLGDALVSVFARVGIGPIALLTPPGA
jgi:hypothetical protein